MSPSSRSLGVTAVAITAFVVMALLGIGLVLFALFGLSDAPLQPAAPPTAAKIVAVQPTLAPAALPAVTNPPSPAPTEAGATPAAPATEALPPTAEATVPPTAPAENPGATVTAADVVNIRSGPGTNYPVIGSLPAGQSVPVIGRDTDAKWFVIAHASGPQGQGWISSGVVSFSGSADSLPILAAAPPPVVPTSAPPPAAPTSAPPTVAPTSPPPAGQRGIVGTLSLCDGRTTYAANERICVVEKIYNSTDHNIDYGILGVNAANLTGGPGWFQSSWTGALTLAPHCTGPVGTCGGQWDDGFPLPAGTYQFTLSICYSSVTTCQGGGEWETLTAPITVVVQ